MLYILPVTQDVKPCGDGSWLETHQAVHYNLRVSNARISGHFVLVIACAPLVIWAGACEKKTKPNDTGAVAALDNAAAPPAAENPADTTPLAGIDVSKLDGDKAQLFYKLVNSFKSPCGKAHSLRTSFTSDTSCKRAPFAVRYVLAMIEDEAPEDRVREEYGHKYEHPAPPVQLDTSRAPHVGASNAPIKLVEFFDYECPHCQMFKAQMEQVISDKSAAVSVSYMMFPLESVHHEARSAAQAVLAAAQQGKFAEMHDRLFVPQTPHGRDAVMGYAKELGLDMAKFQQAYDAVSAQVTSDLKQGEEAGVNATPTLFFNDRKYEGPPAAKYIEMWIDEDLAVNR